MQSGVYPQASAPFDWNNNGVIEPDIAADINWLFNLNGDLTECDARVR